MQYSDFPHLSLNSFIRGRGYHSSLGHIDQDLELPALDDLVETLGGQSKTKAKIARVLEYHLKSIEDCGILERITYDNVKNEWSYCAGQDYPSELAYIRKHILKGV